MEQKTYLWMKRHIYWIKKLDTRNERKKKKERYDDKSRKLKKVKNEQKVSVKPKEVFEKKSIQKHDQLSKDTNNNHQGL